MTYNTLISAQVLSRNTNNRQWVIFDCRFSLADSETGAQAYRLGHIANSRYVHLNNDLSSAVQDYTGRHPLPDFTLLAKKLGTWGVNNRSQVIVYDDAGGAFAGRMWWLLRCMGHDQVAVLDGGIKQWLIEGLSLSTTLPKITASTFRYYLNNQQWLTTKQLENGLASRSIQLIDARTPERFRGEHEPIDPVAGHVPNALNRAFQLNLDQHGKFLSPDQLNIQFKQLIGDYMPEQVVHMCGSGVTACHNLLAMEMAGLSGSKLYAGSWSEWIRNRNRRIN